MWKGEELFSRWWWWWWGGGIAGSLVVVSSADGFAWLEIKKVGGAVTSRERLCSNQVVLTGWKGVRFYDTVQGYFWETCCICVPILIIFMTKLSLYV